ncbi:MAG: M23 family metallopeptidase [Geminicoccaceae bacterium]|nr:M23 family metallopeptidase [Geminicoccaceae bacterium]
MKPILRLPPFLRPATVPLILTAFMGAVVGGAFLDRGLEPPRPAVSALPTAAVAAPAPSPAKAAPIARAPVSPGAFSLGATTPPPPAPPAASPSDPERVVTAVKVGRGDTLFDLLDRAGLERVEAHEVVTSLKGVFDPRRLQVGQVIDLELEQRRGDDDPRLVSLALNLDFAHGLRLARAADGRLAAAQTARRLRTEARAAAARIDDSLYMAARRHDVPDATLLQVIKLFSYDVDFQRDIRPGDRFAVVYEAVATADGGEERTGDLLYAAIETQGRTFTAYRFQPEGGAADYYDEGGRSLRKWLMRTPVDGARLSSGFGRRKHPILGYTRMHKGVDFAAPSGTPIYAAGDGTVVYAGRKGGYGNYVQIRHSAEYGTAYGHMRGFAKGLKKGRRVRQGEVIGYVGTTGRSTGPHLHYEVLKDGTPINPLSLKPQTLAKLEGGTLERFRAQVAKVKALRDGPPPPQFAQRTD